jgi:hypothetical protein
VNKHKNTREDFRECRRSTASVKFALHEPHAEHFEAREERDREFLMM